jgi:hypothetical protein
LTALGYAYKSYAGKKKPTTSTTATTKKSTVKK